jgi:hypothetical protein
LSGGKEMNFVEITSILGIMTLGFGIGRMIEAIFHSINSNNKELNNQKVGK